MNHDRLMRLVVFADIFELKPLRQIKVKLDRRQLPITSNRVFHSNIDLWTVEDGFAFDPLVWNSAAVQSVRQGSFGISQSSSEPK